MIIELILTILIIITILILIILSIPFHVYLNFMNTNFLYNGNITVDYFIFNIKINLEKNCNILFLNIKIKNFKKTIKKINLSKSKDEKDNPTSENTDETDESKNNKKDIDYKKMASLLVKSIESIMTIIKVLASTIKFKGSHVNMRLGLNDGYNTIKICNILWIIFTPLYGLGLEFILCPLVNELELDTKMNVEFKVRLLKLLKIPVIILKDKNLREFTKEIIQIIKNR